MSERRTIWVTRELSDDQLKLAEQLGLNVVVEPAIEISYTGEPDRIGRRLDQNPADGWVFTSQNGVEGYRRLVEAGLQVEIPGRIYAVGEKTARALQELGMEAAFPDRWHAIALAGLITADFEEQLRRGVEDSAPVGGAPDRSGDRSGKDHSAPGSGGAPGSGSAPGSGGGAGSPGKFQGSDDSRRQKADHSGSGREPLLIHWSGNMSRKELGEGLNQAGIRLVRVEVYETRLLPITPPAFKVDAMLFYSPSAVEAFRRSGGFNHPLPELFAIGDTTAEILSLESGEHVHIPPKAASEELIELVASVLNPDSNRESSDEPSSADEPSGGTPGGSGQPAAGSDDPGSATDESSSGSEESIKGSGGTPPRRP